MNYEVKVGASPVGKKVTNTLQAEKPRCIGHVAHFAKRAGRKGGKPPAPMQG